MYRKDPRSELRGHLDSGEQLLWSAQPKKGIVFRSSDAFLIPFSLLWFGGVLVWFITGFTNHVPFTFVIFGIPFVLVGLMMVFGRFIFDAKNRDNTYYGLTEDRIIIKSGVFNKKVKSINLKTLSDVEYTEKSDGSGTISIGPKHPNAMWSSGMNWWPGVKANPQLEFIPNVSKVYRKIVELQKH